jgi:hypothetical protein
MEIKIIKLIIYIFPLAFITACPGCNDNQKQTVSNFQTPAPQIITSQKSTSDPKPIVKTFQNEIFKDITVIKTVPESYLVKGKARVFEASFSYVVEEGHKELLKGFTKADKGAPDWGNFSFNFSFRKREINSSGSLILFEVSMKDGSRLHELIIPLK